MLNVDPKLRPSAQECLLHFFFARPEEKIEQKFTFSTAEWTQYLE